MGKKKEKIIYIDDGRTIADMSGVSRGGAFIPQGQTGDRLNKDETVAKGSNKGFRVRASFKEQLGTFWNAFKMMLPVVGFIGFVLLTIYFVFYLIYLVT